jgi:hypothetical protein
MRIRERGRTPDALHDPLLMNESLHARFHYGSIRNRLTQGNLEVKGAASTGELRRYQACYRNSRTSTSGNEFDLDQSIELTPVP